MPQKSPLAKLPPPAEDGFSLKTRLVAAARQLLEGGGLDALTLRATARAAGVSHMAPYRHFKDKDELLAAVAEQGFRAMTKFMDSATAAPGTQTAMGVAYVSFALENPALYRLMFGANLSPRDRFPGLAAAGAEAYERCIAASAAGAQSNRISEDEDAAPSSSVALWAIVHGLATLAIDGLILLPPPGPPRDAEIAAILKTVSY